MSDSSTGTPLSRRGTWHTYTIADGLAALLTQNIIQDHSDNLWIATFDSGVSRFDGSTFRTFNRIDGLAGNRVSTLLLDRCGRLWFATRDGGVCWYDGRHFHTPDNGEAALSVETVFEDGEGRIWVGGHGVLGFYEDAVYTDLVPVYYQQYGQAPGPETLSDCWGIGQDAEGNLWFGFDSVIRYDGRQFFRYGAEDGVSRAGGNANTVASGPDGTIWVGGNGGLLRYDGRRFQQTPIAYGGFARRIQWDRDGRLWVSGSLGVVYYDGKESLSFTLEDGLAYPIINGMFHDPENLYWFATWGGGISCYDPHSIHLFKEPDIPAAEIIALHEDQQGCIWMGFTAPGNTLTQKVVRFDGESYTQWGKDEGFETNIWCGPICQDATQKLWFGTDRGLFSWDGLTLKKIESSNKELADHRVYGIAAGPNGCLYIGHWEQTDKKELQISRFDGQRIEPLFAIKQEVMSRAGPIIVRSNGEIWFSMRFQGFGCIREGKDTRFYTEVDGLIDNRVFDLVEDQQGNLWIATLGGISRFDGTRFYNFTAKDGLPDDHVHCICIDHQGHLWFGTDGGVVRYKNGVFQAIRSPHLGPIRKIIEDKTGKLWLGMANGLARYTPSKNKPGIRITNIIADQIYSEKKEVEISDSTTQVHFEFQGIGFRTQPRDMLYTYRLQGFDETWCPPTREMRVSYGELAPGKYTFEVKAFDRDLNSSDPEVVCLLVVPDPYRQALTETLNDSGKVGDFIGTSKALRQVQAQLAQVAPTDVTVLIIGETGTGKGVASRSLHQLSSRQSSTFVQVNCGAIPESLVESELFGHEKGAFTGATSRKIGKVELAAGGTLFLDEIGDMPLDAQVKLLHVLDHHRFERVGSTQSLDIDIRIVAATNRDLKQMVDEGTFRADLYFRLQVFTIQLPPLRDRREDLPVLATYFMERMASHLHKPITRLSPQALDRLQSYHWPGNIRELEHTMQRAVIVCSGEAITPQDLGLNKEQAILDPIDYQPTPQEYERQYTLNILEQFNWQVGGEQGAAQHLGLHEATLRSRMKKLGIKRPPP